MREGWKLMQFGNLCELTRGHNPPKSKFINEPKKGYVRFYQIRDGWSDDYKVYVPETPQLHTVLPDDMLMVAYRHIGKVFRGVTGAFNVALCKISNKSIEILDNDYLFYMIPSEIIRGELMKRSERSLIPSMSVVHLKSLQIPIPPPEEQKLIVATLDKAFAAIDQAKANIEKNIENAKELLDSYKLDLLSKYSESEFVSFDSVVKLSRGHNPPKKDFISEPKENYVRFYQIRDGWSDDYKVYVPETPKLHLVEEDEILMVAYRHIGRAFRGVRGAFNVALCKITNLDESILNNDYLFELIPSPFIRGELLKISERSLIPSMSVKELAKLKVPLPKIDEQERLVKLFDEINTSSQNLINNYGRNLNNLEDLKKSILQKAFAGELTENAVAV
ncbi:restriction endonuclease subunit S [Seonamhaeicola maritimus]|uniref:restriction endonuclease subunit S n=1 Tax=Seonamhaeicola maritimus TaxID=2591822 RepID=UPI0024957FB0|nr:restriction endonuclease subunit S [Seonamhaeicola maritimus]